MRPLLALFTVSLEGSPEGRLCVGLPKYLALPRWRGRAEIAEIA